MARSEEQMAKKHAFWLCLFVYIVAILLQAAWESPLRPFVFWIADPGCRLGWYVLTPDYSLNGTVWRFDLFAGIVNAAVYSVVVFVGIFLFKRVTAGPPKASQSKGSTPASSIPK